jgi:hypothetical protein
MWGKRPTNIVEKIVFFAFIFNYIQTSELAGSFVQLQRAKF